MKTLACTFALLAPVVLPACEGTDIDHCMCGSGPEVVLGSFDGEFYLDPSVQGSVESVWVAVYASAGDYLSRQPLIITQTDAYGRYFIHNVLPGHYILDALKDNDADARVTPGDFYLAHNGCCGCEVCVIIDGNTGNFSGELELVQ